MNYILLALCHKASHHFGQLPRQSRWREALSVHFSKLAPYEQSSETGHLHAVYTMYQAICFLCFAICLVSLLYGGTA